jgi:exodeoxyribonuclease VII large subunit
MELDFLRSRLTAAMDARLHTARSRQEALAGTLDALSPLKVLSRGYALATDQNGALLRSPEQTAPGDTIHLRLQKGAVDCRVLGERKEYGHKKADI